VDEDDDVIARTDAGNDCRQVEREERDLAKEGKALAADEVLEGDRQ
jgi:hypothetical protein